MESGGFRTSQSTFCVKIMGRRKGVVARVVILRLRVQCRILEIKRIMV